MKPITKHFLSILIIFMTTVITGCALSGGDSYSNSSHNKCRILLGKAKVALLNGEYQSANLAYSQAYASDVCNDPNDEYVKKEVDSSYSDAAKSFSKTGEYKKSVDFYNKIPTPYQPKYERLIAIAYAEPDKKKTIIEQLQRSENDFIATSDLSDLRYSSGEKTLSLLKAYLSTIDFKTNAQFAKISLDSLDYDDRLIHSRDYEIPIKLAQELNQEKIVDELRAQQIKLSAIESKAIAQQIPGPGTASGNSALLAQRAHFYSQEYGKAGFDELADIYLISYEKSKAHGLEVANQQAIDIQDAADKARAKSEANSQLLTSLLSTVSTAYVATTASRKSDYTPGMKNLAAPISAYQANISPSLPQDLSPSQKQSQTAGSSNKVYPDAGHCLQRDSTSNSLSDFWINSCSFPVNVTWFDAKYCSTGCSDRVKANNRQTVTKGEPGSTYNWVACPEPSTAKGPDGIKTWTNNGRHTCTF